ncbi:MAG: DUF6496 domain-containing protein [Terriglobales bacterium]
MKKPTGRAAKKATSAKRSSGGKYGPKAQKMVETEMRHVKQGKHKGPKQAIAIGLSKARRGGAKVPPRPKREAA